MLCTITSALVSGGTFFLLRHLMGSDAAAVSGPTVPSVEGMAPDQARSLLQAQGLVLIVSEQKEAPAAKAGEILSQLPTAGSAGSKGDVVQVVVGKAAAPARVPGLAGLPLASATQALTNAGLRQGAISRQQSPSVPVDQVLSSVPGQGQEVAKGTAVALVLSSGPGGVPVPRVVGKTEAGARRALKAAGFTVGRPTYRNDEDKMEGRILSQTPAPGALAPGGSAVSLVVNAE